jgi:alkyl sulfatase BDS1-like metallo-beta-lactamase superfamily hydrolase
MDDPLAKPATVHTVKANQGARALINFDDVNDFERAQQGLIATHETGRIELDGRAVWDTASHDFLRQGDPVPETVHAGLWRQGELNAVHGLFEVADGVWQARGYDISNITFLETPNGWLIIDPLTTSSTAEACLQLANETLGERPVHTIIYTHSHLDHFGGILGVTSQDEVDAGNVRIIAPDGFLEEVVRENIIAGPIMARRAHYQFGPLLPTGPHGQVDIGLGQSLPLGASYLIPPTETVYETGTELDIDGLRVIFQNTPDAEAPSEMNFFFPDKNLLCMAENCTHTMHNLYPIRGAQTRDALAWSKYIHEALLLWGDHTDTMFATHHWPRFGKQDVQDFLCLQRDVYRWQHDQTMRLANMGYVPTEIAETLKLPEEFLGESHVQGYYGTVSHNTKAVYTKYLGWYDGNPANLNPLPPVESGKKYVEYMGGIEDLIAKGTKAFEEGDYRWVVQVMNHAVFADPSNVEVRNIQADAFEQLGYQSESGTWRNAYLTAARELRYGSLRIPASMGRQIAHAITIEQLFDMMGVRFDPQKFRYGPTRISWYFEDLEEDHVLGINRSAIYHDPHVKDAEPDVAIRTTRKVIAQILGGIKTFTEALKLEELNLEGSQVTAEAFFACLESFITTPLVEPKDT